jgi:3-phenylpropionate/trans-cinnamate dioxygenase ferredoxin subunit
MPFIRLAAAQDVPAEKSLAVEHGGLKLLICHSKGVFHVVANKCSHAEEPLACGRIRNGWVACPVHGARFDLESGAPLNPPASQPIAVYASRVEDGWVEADIDGTSPRT